MHCNFAASLNFVHNEIMYTRDTKIEGITDISTNDS